MRICASAALQNEMHLRFLATFLEQWQQPPAGSAVCSPVEVNWHDMMDAGLEADVSPKGSRRPVDRRWVSDVTFPLVPQGAASCGSLPSVTILIWLAPDNVDLLHSPPVRGQQELFRCLSLACRRTRWLRTCRRSASSFSDGTSGALCRAWDRDERDRSVVRGHAEREREILSEAKAQSQTPVKVQLPSGIGSHGWQPAAEPQVQDETVRLQQATQMLQAGLMRQPMSNTMQNIQWRSP
eukprot:s5403_g1.t5